MLDPSDNTNTFDEIGASAAELANIISERFGIPLSENDTTITRTAAPTAPRRKQST